MTDIFDLFEKTKETTDFDAIRIRLASPERIRDWSYGEVIKPETINYRTFKPERGGLFCAKIFGPTKDWECNCGKYKRMKHRGIVCDKCGVEVIQSKVRRERLAHIELACPVAHIWFCKGLPSRIGNILDMSMRELERILYFETYVVVDGGDTDIPTGEFLNEDQYYEYRDSYGDDFEAGMGGEAICELLKKIDPVTLSEELRTSLKEVTSVQKKKKLTKRLKVVEAFKRSGNKPEWMILEVIPVIPPDLRPLVPLDGGRFATSDLNDLYRRVINRNNRLKRLQELRAPDVIIRNEKRMLQEAVDSLFDNGRRGRTLKGANNRPLRSLSDMLKGKTGRFRQNLLGKRVDYSGRSVIVIGPELKLHECGLPKKMALELFKPFIFNKLEEEGYVTTIKSAKKMVEAEKEEVWDILEQIIQDHTILLNRAPTLHRLGIQAFQPILKEGEAISIHPLVCQAFNADFDGDQMAVHIPLSKQALDESRTLMLSKMNILSPAHGSPITVPTQDIVLGSYYLTKMRDGLRGEGKCFSSIYEVRRAFDHDRIDLHAKIKVRIDGSLVETSVGRVIFNEVLPDSYPFFNEVANRRNLARLVNDVFIRFGGEKTVLMLDKLKNLGFEYATIGGISISIEDIHIPYNKETLINEALQKVQEVENQYLDGIITNGERYNKVVDIWSQTTDMVANEMFQELTRPTAQEEKIKKIGGEFNSIYMMSDSGARGNPQQIRQLAGMRGLMAKPSGEIIETPITANFREGLTVLQYFISTHGARKGLADTALKTADSGYLTRRLVDVAQDVIITEEDCGTLKGIDVTPIIEAGKIVEPLRDRILGRVALLDVLDPLTGNVLISANKEITEDLASLADEVHIEKVKIRSVLTCEAKHGVCARCYGRDLATGHMVCLGEAVGVIAAQSIGEPGTQLTMRTFHIGGAAAKTVEETSLNAKNPGKVKFINAHTVRNKENDLIVMNKNTALAVVDEEGREKERYSLVYGAKLRVEDHVEVDRGQTLVEWDPYTNVILTDKTGTIKFADILEDITMKEEVDEITRHHTKVINEHYEAKYQPRIFITDQKKKNIGKFLMPSNAHVLVNDGDPINAGDILAKIPRETTKVKDITGGLPRVVELFEARKPKEYATISEIDGRVASVGFEKGMRIIVVVAEDGTEKEYQVPKGAHINIQDGDWVKAGEAFMEGSSNPHDILHVLGDQELQKYLVNEVQEVYRLQGVHINDKHIEVIVKQMLRMVKIEDEGDTEFLPGDSVDKFRFREENDRVVASGGKPATGNSMLLGITKASLSTESFISAASFQETTRVLTEAAIQGKIDHLRGLKENVVVGRLIPAGTGFNYYQKEREQSNAPQIMVQDDSLDEDTTLADQNDDKNKKDNLEDITEQ
ncbi:DNA-directed RNA polymerase subunit beta' [candidate division CSSED10-310 bacterium]|uniref:DNA-directed RNA polymerase subunit beta' n=1 Tax=candidate division CSSED10-310 bacterium TaxID=2855610 RepID=A0ABV6YWY2_UNCC1